MRRKVPAVLKTVRVRFNANGTVRNPLTNDNCAECGTWLFDSTYPKKVGGARVYEFASPSKGRAICDSCDEKRFLKALRENE